MEYHVFTNLVYERSWDQFSRFCETANRLFEEILGTYKDEHDYRSDTELSADDWKSIVAQYKEAVAREQGQPFPIDPKEQLWGAVGAVFQSRMNERAIFYRKHNNIPDDVKLHLTVRS